MKSFTAALLLISFFHTSLIHAADGEMKTAFDALLERHNEALTSATVETTGSVEDAWYLELKKLRLDALAKSDTQTAKKVEAMLLAAGRNGVKLSPPAASETPAPAGKKPGLPEKGSRWDGSTTTYSTRDSKKEFGAAESKITSVEGDTFVLRTSLDQGQIWDWTFKHEDGEIEVINFNLIRAAKWNTKARPGPIVGITGKGRIGNDSMTFSFSWPQSGLVFMGSFDLNLVK